MNKSKARVGPSTHAGVYKLENIKDTADSLSINISDAVASSLASDVEYRIHQVVEEAARFMRHGRRTTLTTSDIDYALRVLNIEPLYGHTPGNPPFFRRALPFPQLPAAGPVYFVEDEEIDFDRVLREEKIALPRGVRWTAHWLAVEGVQPLVPENPPAIPRETEPEPNGVNANPVNGLSLTATNKPLLGAKKLHPAPQQNLVKQVLSRELQLYYARLTSSLLPPTDFARRTAALASLRHDAGLQALLPYLVRWVGEGVVSALRENESEDATSAEAASSLGVLMDVISAILDNGTLFVEPYLHQILPPILSTLLHSSLPAISLSASSSTPPQSPTILRTRAAQTLSRLLTLHSTTYPSLSPRIMKTLLLALVGPGKTSGTREGAIRGLVGVGKEAVRKGLVRGGGARVIGSECAGSQEKAEQALSDAVMDALKILQPPSDGMTESLDRLSPIYTRLCELLGEYFAEHVAVDAAWAQELIGNGEGVSDEYDS